MSRAQGVRAEQITALADYLDSPEFDARERVAIAYATAMTTTPGAVDERLFARLREHFEPKAIVELTAAIAWENYRARFNRALGIESDGFAEGSACALPVRVPTPALAEKAASTPGAA